MHWLDAEPSREIDPVLDCLTFLAREADRPSSPVLLRAGLALSADGHAAVPPDRAGARAGRDARRARSRRRLKGWPSAKCPAILELDDDRAAVLLEMRGGDGADLCAGHRRADVGPARRDRAGLHRPRGRRSKPIRPSEREGERPWDKATRTHWFWSEVWKVRREFWPVLLAALIVNLLALRDAAVHDERLRPGHPQQGGADLVGARARRRASRWASTSSCASRGRS